MRPPKTYKIYTQLVRSKHDGTHEEVIEGQRERLKEAMLASLFVAHSSYNRNA